MLATIHTKNYKRWRRAPGPGTDAHACNYKRPVGPNALGPTPTLVIRNLVYLAIIPGSVLTSVTHSTF